MDYISNMISDFSNSSIKNPNPQNIGVREQNQQPVSPIQKLAQKVLSSNSDSIKFPDNQQIGEAVEIALQQTQAGNPPRRGSIVNILA
jgi:hypothetical protein